MSAFPDIIGTDYRRDAVYKSSVTALGDQNFVAYRKWLRPRHTFDLRWDLLSSTERTQIEDYIRSMYGPFTVFPWFDWRSLYWLYVPLGTGNGTAVDFVIPGKGTSQQQFFANGSTALPIERVSAGTGPDGEDVVTFVTAPAAATALSCRFTGRRRFSVRARRLDPITELVDPPGHYEFGALLSEDK